MNRSFDIALAQMTPADGDIDANLAKMKAIINECKRQFPNVRLLLFPELCTTGYVLSEVLKELAETPDGSTFQYMSRMAQQFQLYIAYGYVEKDDIENIYNSLMLIHPNGQCIGNYRKIHLTPFEKAWFSSGAKPVLVDTDLGRIGLMICWDLAFPELARYLGVHGAEILLAPCAWESPFHVPFQKFAMARAIDNTVYVAVCNQIGRSSSFYFFGLSSIYGPDGNKIATANMAGREEMIHATIDPNEHQALKKNFYTMMDERRIDLYREWNWGSDK
ncbi:carbon-nitrogen hydrolase family protein [Geobacillus sp. BMUD]|uniref:carbon-nitrogen hydrolase family protein n=1 Tax=Geobacillus TaxID=129337 RepID=UPI0004DFBACD|nr:MULTISPECIES: carbon-nitrogen hydrolase family protein [Geobacillus]NNU83562.1 carbon-nitrogen hydrolase family protein [Geobacillus sp. BMUD]